MTDLPFVVSLNSLVNSFQFIPSKYEDERSSADSANRFTTPTEKSELSMPVRKLTARWVFPVCGAPIEYGVIEICDGRIAGVGSRGASVDSHTIDLGNAAILPGLINCHAHLEFSDLAQPIEPPQPFAHWIGKVMLHRRSRTTPLSELIRDGLAEVLATGTTVVGEIATGDWSPSFLVAGDPHVVAFRECLAPVPERVAAQIEIARQHLADCAAAREAGVAVTGALSPHAPYTVLPELFEQLVALAAEHRTPLCLHLAETQAELELLRDGTGELRDMLDRIGLWRADLHPPGRRPLDFLQQMAVLDHALIAHGNYLDADERAFLARHPNIATVYCPRTHRFFGHSAHPWRELLAGGASVVLGTDGRSSNPDYTLWSEVLWLDELTQGTQRPLLLGLATIRGARALGLDETAGDLTIGKSADLCVIELTDAANGDPWAALFASRAVCNLRFGEPEGVSPIAQS